ncbi:hypothetical protein [uncultured Ornithinimicrobium sp.]|uniref:hypothetical protein n=1 Tax=uncultured Ornithinimicrobium sp. TaxID=259307 RepID=UPI002592C434|nr:hypothetical protein [uncultured Ornithinimicrobium sp.]
MEGHLPADEVLKPRLSAVLLAAATDPKQPEQLEQIAPDRTAVSVLAAAVYVVLSHPDPGEFMLAMGLFVFEGG